MYLNEREKWEGNCESVWIGYACKKSLKDSETNVFAPEKESFPIPALVMAQIKLINYANKNKNDNVIWIARKD